MASKIENSSIAENLGIDYVISYVFADTDKASAEAGLKKLVEALAKAGLEVNVRNGTNSSLFVFVKAARIESFNNQVYRYRVRDWLHGVRAAEPDREAHKSIDGAEPATEAERLRIVHHLITSQPEDGGAGIVPGSKGWENVKSIFALHDHQFNKAWIKKWSTTTFLKPEDLDEIRDKFGEKVKDPSNSSAILALTEEKVAFYFAFTQSYFAFLVLPAIFGFSAWVMLGSASPVFAIVVILWCVTFVENWKKQETDLGIRWGVRGVSAIQEKRHDFKYEKEVTDSITGETVKIFPAKKRMLRQTLSAPFAMLAVLMLGTLIASCFAIEIFLSEVYNGPGKSVLVFLPTGLLTTLVPTLTTLLTNVATRLNDFENYETTDAYHSAMTSKLFILNFITSYLGIFLTAFVYVPFGSIIVPYLDVFQLTAKPDGIPSESVVTSSPTFEINPARLRKQVIYFTVTAQIVNFALETVVPYVKRRGAKKFEQMKTERAAKKGGVAPNPGMNDAPEEAAFLTRVRNEAELDVYDATDDLREMVVQFGYLALFSVVWPLVPVSFLVNNWIELRSDAFKICMEMQRPTPQRADGIGSWLDSLSFLAWLGSVTTAALVYMFSNDGLGPDGTPTTIQGWALLLIVFLSEHLYLAVRLAVRTVISKMESPGMKREKAERYMLRKRLLQGKFGEDAATELPGSVPAEKITRESLEDQARAGSLKDISPADRFWARQRGWQESAQIGAGLIERLGKTDDKKDQ